MRKSQELRVAVVVADEDRPRVDLVLGPLAALVRDVQVAAPADPLADVPPPDVVHAVGWTAAVACSRNAVAPVLISPPPLASGHGLPRTDDEVDALRSADTVLVSSSRQREEIHQLGVPWYRLTTVPPTIDVELYSRRGERAPRSELLRVAAEAAPASTTAEGLMRVLHLVDDAEAVLFASTPEVADALRERAASEGLAGRTAAVSPRSAEERAWWLRSADAAIDVPEGPADGDFALQAMACGTAVVSTPVDVLEDAVVHGVTGMHVPVGDAISLARALRSVLADDFTIESLGMAASDRAIHRFSPARVARDLATAYARIAPDASDELEDDDIDQSADAVV